MRLITAFILIIGIFLAVQTSVKPSFNIELSLSKDVALESEDLEAVCEVKTNQTKRNYQVVWFKILPDSNGDEVEIATNFYVNEEFKETGRYEAGLQLMTPGAFNDVRFSLHISDLRSGDSGYIGCRIDASVETFQLFTVQVPVQSITWTTSIENSIQPTFSFYPNENVSFTEGETRRFFCLVYGGYPRPKVEILIGNEDLTELFTRSDHLMRVDDGAPNGLQTIYYDVELKTSNKGLSMEYEYNEKPFKCVAQHLLKPSSSSSSFSSSSSSLQTSNITDDNHEKSSVIQVQITKYKPKFWCEPNKQVRIPVKIGEKNFNLTCFVKANPEIFNATIFPAIDDDNNSSLFLENETTRSVERINETVVRMVLIINKISEEFLGTYIFEAENAVGSERQIIELYKDVSFELKSMFAMGNEGTKHQLKTSFITFLFIVAVIALLGL